MEEATTSLDELSLGPQQSEAVVSVPTHDTSPLMDKVPTEIRLRIFGLALQTERGYVRIIDRREPWEQDVRRLNISLFLVSKKVSQEAQDAFLENHTIIGGAQLPRRSFMPLVRSIEFRPAAHAYAGPLFNIRGCSHKLKKVVMARETLPGTQTLRHFMESHSQRPGQCVELGVWKLVVDSNADRDVFVKHFGLVKALPLAKVLVSTQSLMMLTMNKTSYEQGGMGIGYTSEEARAARLAWWLGALQKAREEARGAILSAEDQTILDGWYERFLIETGAVRLRSCSLPDNVDLQDVNVAEHGEEVVEWATELLALNMRGMEPRHRARSRR